MINCPACGAENIEGADHCAQCGQPLVDLGMPTPSNRIEKAISSDHVSVLKPKPMIVVQHNQTVGDVLKFMLDQKIGCVFVSDGDDVVGVFTERDALIRLNVDIQQHVGKPISEFMTDDPRTLSEDASIAFAIRMMDQGGYRHILVLDQNDQPAGVTSVRNILRYLADRMT